MLSAAELELRGREHGTSFLVSFGKRLLVLCSQRLMHVAKHLCHQVRQPGNTGAY